MDIPLLFRMFQVLGVYIFFLFESGTLVHVRSRFIITWNFPQLHSFRAGNRKQSLLREIFRQVIYDFRRRFRVR